MTIKNIANDQRKLFWVLHLGGWLVWGLVGKYGFTWAISDEMSPNYFAYVMLISVIGMVLSLGLRYVYRFLWNRPPWLQALGFLLGSAAAGFVWIKSRSYIYNSWFAKTKDSEEWMHKLGEAAEMYEKIFFMESFTTGWIPMLAWSVLYFAIKYYQIFQEVQKSALKSAAMAHEAVVDVTDGVEDADLQARLLGDLTQRRLLGRLIALGRALGQRPDDVAAIVAPATEHQLGSMLPMADDDTTGAEGMLDGEARRPRLAHLSGAESPRGTNAGREAPDEAKTSGSTPA